MRPGTTGIIASMIVVIGAVAGGCALDPVQPTRDPSARPPSPSGGEDTSNRPTPIPMPTGNPTSNGFSEYTATTCNGKPTGEQVISVVRPKLELAATVQITVTQQPLCAGIWQYTVLGVPNREPVHAVTRGEPGKLTVVAAGTNPCIPAVRVSAPSGIRTVLGCDTVTTTTTTTPATSSSSSAATN